MKKKGFTLIELLAVIAILGIILSISVVAVSSLLKKQKVNNEKNTLRSIFSAAKLYCADNPQSDKCKPGYTDNIYISDLVSSGYLEIDSSMTLFDSKSVKVKNCADDYHVKYSLNESVTASDGTTVLSNYNDCGCSDQNGVLFTSSGDSDTTTAQEEKGLCTN